MSTREYFMREVTMCFGSGNFTCLFSFLSGQLKGTPSLDLHEAF